MINCKIGSASGIETSTNFKSKNYLIGISTHLEQKPKLKIHLIKQIQSSVVLKTPRDVICPFGDLYLIFVLDCQRKMV